MCFLQKPKGYFGPRQPSVWSLAGTPPPRAHRSATKVLPLPHLAHMSPPMFPIHHRHLFLIRLLGPNGSTLKAIELLTECYVMVQGNTVSAMGPHKGLKQVRKLVEDCFRNYHPVYHIKAMMIKRELERDPALKTESWDRFLPKFRKGASKRAKKPVVQKKPYTPFPPAPMPRKVDAQIESGEFFLSDEQKLERKAEARAEQQAEGTAASKAKREQRFNAPKEEAAKPRPSASAATAVGKDKRSSTELVASIKDKAKRKKST